MMADEDKSDEGYIKTAAHNYGKIRIDVFVAILDRMFTWLQAEKDLKCTKNKVFLLFCLLLWNRGIIIFTKIISYIPPPLHY